MNQYKNSILINCTDYVHSLFVQGGNKSEGVEKELDYDELFVQGGDESDTKGILMMNFKIIMMT